MNNTRIEELTGAVEDLIDAMKAREPAVVQAPPVHVSVPPSLPRQAYVATVIARDAAGDILKVQFDPV